MEDGALMSRLADYALYVLIAVALVGAIYIYALNSDASAGDRFVRWGGLAINTLLLYGYILKETTRLWRYWRFWVTLLLVVCIHLAVFTAILLRAEHWKVIWFLPMYPIEFPVVLSLCQWSAGARRSWRLFR